MYSKQIVKIKNSDGLDLSHSSEHCWPLTFVEGVCKCFFMSLFWSMPWKQFEWGDADNAGSAVIKNVLDFFGKHTYIWSTTAFMSEHDPAGTTLWNIMQPKMGKQTVSTCSKFIAVKDKTFRNTGPNYSLHIPSELAYRLNLSGCTIVCWSEVLKKKNPLSWAQMQTLELKISQAPNVTYKEKRGRHEGKWKREGQMQNDKEIKKKTVSDIMTVNNLQTTISVLKWTQEIKCNYSRKLFCINIQMSKYATGAAEAAGRAVTKSLSLPTSFPQKSLCLLILRGNHIFLL